jgi:diaminopimelate epimerase
MRLSFTKMHGLGNDFVVLDAVRRPLEITPAQIRWLADRRFGVGCDQVLLVTPPAGADADFGYRIFNADGGEVEQCGNGARCFARFVREKGLTQKTEIRVETRAGVIVPRVEADGQVTVDMGPPRFQPETLPFLAEREAAEYDLEVDGEGLRVGAVSMGNPHVVLRVPDVDVAPVRTLGPRIEVHPRFPRRVNAGFLQVVDPRHVRLRVWERGAGETLACGTGACAAVAVGRRWLLLADTVDVDLPGGRLRIRWEGGTGPVWMTGPAVTVYEGEIEL